jgi:hypothetical protein
VVAVVTYDIGVRLLQKCYNNWFDCGCVRLVGCDGMDYNFPAVHFFVVYDSGGEDLSYLMARLFLSLGFNASGISYQVDDVVMPSVFVSGKNLLAYLSCTVGDCKNAYSEFLRIKGVYYYRHTLVLGPMPILWNSNSRFQLSVVYKIFGSYRICFED